MYIYNIIISQPLRNYPVHFALAIASIFDDLKRTALGCPRVDEAACGLQAFRAAAAQDREAAEYTASANLASVYIYLRGCKSLKIPENWRAYVPHVWPSPTDGL